MDESQPVSELLRLHRARAGLTQRELAVCAGMSARGVQDIERGVSMPHRRTLRRLTVALGLRGGDRRLFERAALQPRQPGPRRKRLATANLPIRLTSFVGRTRESSELSQLLDRARLITLTGTGGIGKTRLALEVAARQTGKYPDGVWFVNLATTSDPVVVDQSVATVLGVPEGGTTSLIRAIRSRNL